MKYNFTKLLQSGGSVRKYKGGGGSTKVSNTSNSGIFDRGKVNDSYLDVYDNIFNDPNFDVESFNNFLGDYYALRTGTGYSGDRAIKYNGVQDYQQRFNDYGFHTNAFQEGWEYNDPALADSGDRFGDSWKADPYYGAITHQRYANSFNDEELQRANERAKQKGFQWVEDDRASGIYTGDGRKFYRIEKLTPGNSDAGGEDGETPGASSTPSNTSGTKSTTETPGVKPVTFADRLNLMPPKPDPWTDWIPLSAQYGNDLISAARQKSLQEKMRFPLIEGPYLQHIKTNDYFRRAAMGQTAADMRHRAEMQNGSDMVTNLENARLADEQASQIELQAEGIKSEKDAQERQAFEETVNKNKQTAAAVANHNYAANTAAWNNILDARRRYDLAKTQATNSYIGNMYTSHGEWLKDTRINQQGWLKGYNGMLADQQIRAAQQRLIDARDFTKSAAYDAFKKDLINNLDSIDGLTAGQIELLNSEQDSPEKEELLQQIFQGDSAFAKNYRAQFERSLNDSWKDYTNEWYRIQNWLQAQNLMQPEIISNQGRYRPIKMSNVSPLYVGQVQPVIAGLAKGGTIRARYIDYQNHRQKEQQYQKTAQHKRNELSTKKLTNDLDRLSKEQMILLRSIFK